MAKVVCVLYDDPIDGYPPKYARDNIPKITKYPDGQTAPTPSKIDFKPGELLGCVSGELGLRKFLEDAGHTLGGKNASLGEMVRNLGEKGVKVPPGFATTAEAYWQYVEANGLRRVIADSLKALDAGHASLAQIGATVRQEFLRGTLPKDLADAIQSAYRQLCSRANGETLDVAVRSSATAEDLPDASFAGQQESYLNIRGEAALLDACRRCYASLFTDRAISYRRTKGFDHMKVALSIGIQRMVRSDLGSAGVMFSIDTETGFDKVVLINAAWGLGENRRSGRSRSR